MGAFVVVMGNFLGVLLEVFYETRNCVTVEAYVQVCCAEFYPIPSISMEIRANMHLRLELRHPRCVCNVKVQCKEVKNTTSLLSVDSVVNKTTCFGLLGGHNQFQQVLAIGD